MEREQHEATIELGIASVETQGVDGFQPEIGGLQLATGLSDD